MQMLVAPAKLTLGMIVATMICLPSLYIFISLSGIDASVLSVAGALFAAVCLCALLLIGFAPVAWIFFAIDRFHSLHGHAAFGLLDHRVRFAFDRRDVPFRWGQKEQAHLRIWTMIFLLTCLQMTATCVRSSFRPIPAG